MNPEEQERQRQAQMAMMRIMDRMRDQGRFAGAQVGNQRVNDVSQLRAGGGPQRMPNFSSAANWFSGKKMPPQMRGPGGQGMDGRMPRRRAGMPSDPRELDRIKQLRELDLGL